MRYPHRNSMADFRQGVLAMWKWSDFLVMNQQSVSVLDLQIMRVGRFEFDYAAFNRVCHDPLQRLS